MDKNYRIKKKGLHISTVEYLLISKLVNCPLQEGYRFSCVWFIMGSLPWSHRVKGGQYILCWVV